MDFPSDPNNFVVTSNEENIRYEKIIFNCFMYKWGFLIVCNICSKYIIIIILIETMNQGSTTLICNKQQKTSFVHNKTMIFLETMTLIDSNNNLIMTSEIMKLIQIIPIQIIITTMAQHFMMIGRLCSIIFYAQIHFIF